MGKKQLSEAVDTLRDALLTDADYRRAWIDNISICFQDTFRIAGGIMPSSELRDIANAAANSFIDILCIEQEGAI